MKVLKHGRTAAALAAAAVLAAGWLLPGCSAVREDRTAPQASWSQDLDRAAKSPDYYYSAGRARLDDGPVARGRIIYPKPDRLGRTGRVVADVTAQTAAEGRARDRSDMEAIRPSGWPAHNPLVLIRVGDNLVYRGRLFNRSHLVAKSLGGENRAENMITGTRTQNVGVNDQRRPGGMQYTEMKAASWLASHPDGDVRYDATPLYRGDEPIPRGVAVDVRSSDGTIDEHVTVANTAAGIPVDYTGHGDYSEYERQALESRGRGPGRAGGSSWGRR